MLKSQILLSWVTLVQDFQMMISRLFTHLKTPSRLLSSCYMFKAIVTIQNNCLFDSIKLEQEATFQAEPEKDFDPKAIKIIVGGTHSGYVCRGLIESFHKWFEMGYKIDAGIERKNGTAEHPEVYLYVSIRMTA